MALDPKGTISLKCFLLGFLILAFPYLTHTKELFSYTVAELWPYVFASHVIAANTAVFLLYRDDADYEVRELSKNA